MKEPWHSLFFFYIKMLAFKKKLLNLRTLCFNSYIMKRILIILLLFHITIAVKAIHYRGFVEGGVTWVGHAPDDSKTHLGYIRFHALDGMSLQTSHGIQLLPKLYLGVGYGYNGTSGMGLNMPLFADARWDFFGGTKRGNFFVALKLGGQLGDDKLASPSDDVCVTQTCFYYEPAVGFRFRITRILGLNFTMSLFPNPVKYPIYDKRNIVGHGTKNLVVASFKLGIDF